MRPYELDNMYACQGLVIVKKNPSIFRPRISQKIHFLIFIIAVRTLFEVADSWIPGPLT